VPFAFEKLLVYQKSVGLAVSICAATRGFPRGNHILASQLSRAAMSIAPNIAEGNGRATKADRYNFFTIARGSVQECVPLLEIAVRGGLLSVEDYRRLSGELEHIARMLSGLINRLERVPPEPIRE
jgi:four helix bundle protein